MPTAAANPAPSTTSASPRSSPPAPTTNPSSMRPAPAPRSPKPATTPPSDPDPSHIPHQAPPDNPAGLTHTRSGRTVNDAATLKISGAQQTFLTASVGQRWVALTTCLASSQATASLLSDRP